MMFPSPRTLPHYPGRFLQGAYDDVNSSCVLANRFLMGTPGEQGPGLSSPLTSSGSGHLLSG